MTKQIIFAAISAAMLLGCGSDVNDTTPAAAAGSSSGSGGGTPSGPPCTSTSQCTADLGEPAICVTPGQTPCVPLLSEECTEVLGEFPDTDALYGILAPLTGPDAAIGKGIRDAAALAQKELSAAPSAPRITYVVCDEAANPTRAEKHLLQEVQVHALLGPTASANVLSAADVLSQGLLVSPRAASPALLGIDPARAVWGIEPNWAMQSRAMAAVSADVEVAVRDALGLSPSDPIRLALLEGDAFTAETDDLATRLVFNGKPATQNGPSSLRLKLASGDAAVASQLHDFAPHILVVASPSPAVQTITAIEAAGPAAVAPEYVLPDESHVPELAALGAGNDALRKRLRGTAWPPPPNDHQSFVVRYQAATSEPPPPFADAAYDAAYALGYATAAAKAGGVVADAFAKLVPPGALVQVGPVSAAQGFAAAGAGGDVDLDGVTGKLDFDATFRSPRTDLDVYCVSAQGALATAGQTYVQASSALSGTFSCP